MTAIVLTQLTGDLSEPCVSKVDKVFSFKWNIKKNWEKKRFSHKCYSVDSHKSFSNFSEQLFCKICELNRFFLGKCWDEIPISDPSMHIIPK